jgi:hypothetical protein
MEKEGLSVTGESETRKFSLDHIHKMLSHTLKIKKRIHRLNKMFNKNLESLNVISKEIKSDTVTV